MIVHSAEFVKSATKPAEYPPPGLREIAFCGRSNVGKSSCLNALAQRKALARVSRTPGRTRLINFFDLRVAETLENPQEIRFADLPGYGFASGPKSETKQWQQMIEKYLGSRPDALVVLVDGELGAQPSDIEMVRWAESLGRKVIAVATKLDKLARSRRKQQTDKIAGQLAVREVIAFSAKERFGVEELWHALLSV
ncbi:MAG: ribosome biogenesis GTP-binding protein YihA/YsxC [Myxococcales bacterium]|nr:ribosome biogenesis GTP-binding protein YihA/YsxC [Myxococcales bacterium]